MDLQHVRVRNYKSIDDTGWVEIDDLTCLIGKNESGKTVFMEAIERLSPAYGSATFDPATEYPKHRWPTYRRRHESDPDPVVSARFAIDEEERDRLQERHARPVDGTVTVTRDYDGRLRWDLAVDEAAYIDDFLAERELPDAVRNEAMEAASIAELEATLRRIDPETAGIDESALEAVIGTVPSTADELADRIGSDLLAESLPAIQYVGEYATLDARIDLDAFAERVDSGDLTASDRAFEALCTVANLDRETVQEDDPSEVLTELESASREVNEAVARYWSQSDDVGVRLRLADEGEVIELRVENLDHGVTVPFDRRSRGFRWFFSTVCTLLATRDLDDDRILLLDEPGLHLHPKAKREFRRFLDSELAGTGTVMYSTHSPFMIDTDRAYRTKAIVKDPDGGTHVVEAPGTADDYTRFPLRSVFELDVMETVVARSELLCVEDETTYEYLYNGFELLEGTDATVLDRRWTTLPIGSLENTDTVRAVFDASDGEVAVLHDGRSIDGWSPPVDAKTVPLGSFVNVDGTATIEDLLSESFYLTVVNRAYAAALSAADCPERLTAEELASVRSTGPIVERLSAYFEAHDVAGGTFDRAVPSRYLQANREEFVDVVDMDTRKTFSSLARRLNGELESIGRPSRRSGSFLDSLLGR
ncbi:ATP-dependent nuclease [Halorubrum vacuolatum]|uniref:AAA ATPase domain-containing protein n=1 Tax=Halorubrum vacuolatum TaxID=63740 RepID=A0A238VZ43_HALVU|nr:AAA family ATPase [Halorubrum vacuolatum]SNR39143.1 AAA ATPase domain-containing protein [Halorubrum vacuolatum]